MVDPTIDPTMEAKMLSAPLIIKNFVHGESTCDYQQYMLELINYSEWFSKKYPGGFRKPISEANGECDAINENYQLDFKLLASKTAMQAKSVLSPQIYTMNGVTSFCGSKVDGSIQSTRIFAAFRPLSLNDLIRIGDSKNKKYGEENDIHTVLKTLKVKKNLLLFFPYIFSFREPHQYNAALESIITGLNHDFGVAFLYREQYASKYDTFLTCIYEKYFLIFLVCDGVLRLVDSVETKNIIIFTRLLDSYGEWWK